MKIIETSYIINDESLDGHHIVEDDSGREYKIEFTQDKAGNYGWFQWGASADILCVCSEKTEELSTQYLMGELTY